MPEQEAAGRLQYYEFSFFSRKFKIFPGLSQDVSGDGHD
jgi:hypothetical protein